MPYDPSGDELCAVGPRTPRLHRAAHGAQSRRTGRADDRPGLGKGGADTRLRGRDRAGVDGASWRPAVQGVARYAARSVTVARQAGLTSVISLVNGWSPVVSNAHWFSLARAACLPLTFAGQDSGTDAMIFLQPARERRMSCRASHSTSMANPGPS